MSARYIVPCKFHLYIHLISIFVSMKAKDINISIYNWSLATMGIKHRSGMGERMLATKFHITEKGVQWLSLLLVNCSTRIY